MKVVIIKKKNFCSRFKCKSMKVQDFNINLGSAVKNSFAYTNELFTVRFNFIY